MPGLSIETRSGVKFNKLGFLMSTNKSPSSTAQDTSSDQYFSFVGDLIGQIKENLPKLEALGVIKKNNPELASVLEKIISMKANGNFNGINGINDIKDLSKKDVQLLIDNLPLLHSSGMLEIAKSEINDPAYDAFVRLMNKNPQLARSLASLGLRALTTENFGINNITNDEILLIMNDLDLLNEKDGILNALGDRLPKEVREMVDLCEKYPRTYNSTRRILNTFPSFIDHGRAVYTIKTMPAPVKATVMRNIKVVVSVSIATQSKSITRKIGSGVVSATNAAKRGISKAFSKLKFW